MQITVLDRETLGDDLPLKEELQQFGSVTLHPRTAKEQRYQRSRDAQVIITNKVVFDRELLEQLPELKLICVAATGTNNIDLTAAGELGIAVTNVAGYSTASVVQHTLSLVLYQQAQLGYYHDYVDSGRYSESGLFTCLDRPYDQLAGLQWGIIGLGTIGRGVARVAESFGCRTVWCSASGSTREEQWPRLAVDELLRTSDIISIHAPLNRHTRGLLGFAELAMLKPSARLYNLGRGGIVDEAALVDALLNNRLAAAGLDVFFDEPLPADSPLLTVNDPQRLLLTPHIAWSSRRSRRVLLEGLTANISAWLDGDSLNRVEQA